MSQPLATPQDVADIWRPLSTIEREQAANLIPKAEGLLRQRLAFDLDERMTLDASDPLYLAAPVVANVLAGMVKRVMVNPDNAASISETIGPYSDSQTFASVNDAPGLTGGLEVTDADVAALLPSSATGFATPFTMHTRPRHHHRHDLGAQCL